MVICACIMYLKSALVVRKRFSHNALTPHVSITNASQNLWRISGRRELIYLITAIKSHTFGTNAQPERPKGEEVSLNSWHLIAVISRRVLFFWYNLGEMAEIFLPNCARNTHRDKKIKIKNQFIIMTCKALYLFVHGWCSRVKQKVLA